ncbi:MAG: hypothetical protein JW741_29760 [Sedimentisphaerales bacterium]|nr:hypothetical protein [Sedimentisphaerales bacterium]
MLMSSTPFDSAVFMQIILPIAIVLAFGMGIYGAVKSAKNKTKKQDTPDDKPASFDPNKLSIGWALLIVVVIVGTAFAWAALSG